MKENNQEPNHNQELNSTKTETNNTKTDNTEQNNTKISKYNASLKPLIILCVICVIFYILYKIVFSMLAIHVPESTVTEDYKNMSLSELREKAIEEVKQEAEDENNKARETSLEMIEILNIGGYTEDGKVKEIYNRQDLQNKLKQVSEKELIQLLRQAKYTEDINISNPNNIFNNKEMNCQAFSTLVGEYILSNYNTKELYKDYKVNFIFTQNKDRLHMYVMFLKLKNNTPTLIDLSVNIQNGADTLEQVLKDIEIYKN